MDVGKECQFSRRGASRWPSSVTVLDRGLIRQKYVASGKARLGFAESEQPGKIPFGDDDHAGKNEVAAQPEKEIDAR
ncbi:MAG: hypothetical protein WBQ34_09460 [Candidatus Acidiferrales bacterium]